MDVETEEPTLEALGPDHLDGAVALSRQEGWPHRPEDWALSLELSRGVVALRAGRVVATALASRFGEAATMNMIIVDPSMRGRGLGRRIMAAAMALAPVPEMRLVSTQEGFPLYRKLGFEPAGEIRQHQGTARPVSAPHGVSAGTAEDVEALVALDRAAYGAARDALVRRLAELGEVAVLRHSGRVTGFAVCRRFGRGEVVGPVVAATLDDAWHLVVHFVASRPGAFLRVDTPADAGLGPALETMGLAHVGGGTAMRRGGQSPRSAPVTTFALVSHGFG